MLEWMLVAGGAAALGWAAWQDLKTHEFDAMSMIELGAIGLLYKLAFAPGSINISLCFGLLALLIGCMVFEARSWTWPDAAMLGLAGWVSLPVDFVLFSAICISILGIFAVISKIRKKKEFAGLPMILIMYLAYNLMILCL